MSEYKFGAAREEFTVQCDPDTVRWLLAVRSRSRRSVQTRGELSNARTRLTISSGGVLETLGRPGGGLAELHAVIKFT